MASPKLEPARPLGVAPQARVVAAPSRFARHALDGRALLAAARMAAAVADDFDRLLRTVDALAKILLEDLDPRDLTFAAAQAIATAVDQAAPLSRLLRGANFTDAARSRPCSANDLVRALAPTLRRTLPPGAQLMVNVNPANGQLVAHPEALERVILGAAALLRPRLRLAGARLEVWTPQSANAAADTRWRLRLAVVANHKRRRAVFKPAALSWRRFTLAARACGGRVRWLPDSAACAAQLEIRFAVVPAGNPIHELHRQVSRMMVTAERLSLIAQRPRTAPNNDPADGNR